MRTLILDTVINIGKEITIQGWVKIRRDHGKLIFLDIVDRSARVQVVVNKKVSETAYLAAQQLHPEDAIELTGKVNERPANAVNKELATGTVELEATKITCLASAQTLPFDMGSKELNLELPTLLDHRPITLKHEKIQAIFKVQERLIEEFRSAAKKLDCLEVFPPTIAPAASEGGADVFKVNYYDHDAFLAQSPQLYKQILVGAFERVYMISHAYRAEPSVTTRHLSELVQIDVELGFVTFSELLDALEFVGTSILMKTAERSEKELKVYGMEKPHLSNKVPRLTLREAQTMIKKRTGRDVSHEQDLNPEDEKEICLWSREEHDSDFVTITHFPTRKKPFYTHPDPEDPTYSLSYDLLFRGIEISSGSQRIHNYDMLIKALHDRGIDPTKLTLYLDSFKYGMPPEGGFSFGIERLTMKLLGLSNIREASLFPRDMERVDERLSKFSHKNSQTEQ